MSESSLPIAVRGPAASARPLIVRPSRLDAVATAFAREAVALVRALASPGRIIGEVEQMQALHREANAIEPTDPARAARLRALASKVGLP